MSEPKEINSRLSRTIWLIAGLATIVVISTINRKSGIEFQRMQVWDVLRGRDIMTLFVLAPSATILSWMLFRITCVRKSILLDGIVILSIFFLGMAFGIHEPTNALNCTKIPPGNIKDSLLFFDDGLSHWIFFAGFLLFTLAIAIAETRDPMEKRVPTVPMIISILFGTAVAASIYANMVNEKTGIDIAVLLLTAATVLSAHIINGKHSLLKMPFTLLVYIGLGGGALSTLVKWGFQLL